MHIEFINKETVRVVKSLVCHSKRPAPNLRKIITKEEIIEEFRKRFPSYVIHTATGPDKISNFKGKNNCKGEWIFSVGRCPASLVGLDAKELNTTEFPHHPADSIPALGTNTETTETKKMTETKQKMKTKKKRGKGK